MTVDLVRQEQLQKDLRALGVSDGDSVALGISFRSVGAVEGGPEGFIQALLDVIGASGTVMIPTFTRGYPLWLVRRHRVPVFRREETVAYTGVIAEHIRNDARAIRSAHPTNSYAAIGDRAGYLLGGHDHDSSAYSPYSKLADIGGKILLIGINYDFVGIRHEAQARAGLLELIPPYSGALFSDPDGVVRVFVRKDPGGCVRRLPTMIDDLRQAGIVGEGAVGKAKAVTIPAREGLDIMVRLLHNSPERYLCDAASCLWCREIERRLNLRDRVIDKKWFQRSTFLRFPLDVYNHLRVSNNGVLGRGSYLLGRGGRRLMPRWTGHKRGRS